MASLDPPSLNRSANILVELAGMFQAGRPAEAHTSQTRPPHAHRHVHTEMDHFIEVAEAQYRNGVTMIAALSVRLRSTAAYTGMDEAVRRTFDNFIQNTRYRRPSGG